MHVRIILKTKNGSNFEISSLAEEGRCFVEIREGKIEIGANVSVEDLKLALRKLTTK